MEQRLIDLEIRHTHLDRFVDELNQVVIGQQKTIDALLAKVAALQARLEGGGAAQPTEKPPHY